MTSAKGTRFATRFGSIACLVALMLTALAGTPALWSQTYQNIGVEAGPDRPTGFMDAFKDQGRFFVNASTGDLVPTDGSGNPTADAMVVVFDNRPFSAWNPPIDDPAQDQPNPSGTYTISFTGYATVSNAVGTPPYPTLVFSTPVYTAATNTTTLTAYMPGGATYSAGQALMVINFTNTQLSGPSGATNTGIANLQVIRPGFTLAQASTQIFDPAFLNALAPFNYLRFMGWLGTNTCPYYESGNTPVITWSQRTLPTDAFQGMAGYAMGAPCYGTAGIPTDRYGAWGISWEYVILLANAVNKDIWINIPVSATGSPDSEDPTYDPSTSSYVYQLATLLKNGNTFTGNKGLNSNLHIYIEHSNEVWNSGFRQYPWNQSAASAEVALGGSVLNNDGDTNSSDWANRRHIKRLYEIAEIFKSVFGAGSLNTTIRPVYAWFQFDEGANSGAANALAWFKNTYGPPSNYFYGMAQGDYFSASSDTDPSVDAVLDDMQSSSNADISYVQQNLATGQQYGLPLFAYEGGPGDTDPNFPDSYLQYQIEANRTFAAQNGGLGIDSMVENHLRDNWFPYGGSNFGYFMLSSAYSRYGSWGATDDICNLSTPKYSAILNLTGYTPSAVSTPQNVNAVAGNQTVTLSWPAVTGAVNYTVERGTSSGGPYTTLGTACSPGYTDLAVSNGTTYYYVVAAVNTSGQSSSLSTPVAATPITQGQQSQTITFTPPTSPVTYGVSPIALSATASSGLAVTFSVASGPGTVSGSTLTITGAGTVVVAANQGGNGTYAAAPQVTQNVVVNQASQTITFTQPATPVSYGVSPISLSATSTSGLAVTFSVTSGPGTISGGTLTVTGVGTIVVAANQAGNTNYSAAAQVTKNVVVNQGSQTINFTAPTSPVTYGVSPITLSATASSGLAVTFSVVSGPGTVSGSTLTITGVGTVVVAANQAGNADYTPAAQVTQSVVVNSAGSGTLLAYEPFGEASGTTLQGASGSGDSGWGEAWVEQFGSTVEPGYEILSTTPLTYSGLQTTANYAIGGYEYQSAGRQLNVSSGGPFNSYLSGGLIGASGQTIWLSLLLREDVSNGDINAVYLNNSTGGSAWVPASTDSIGIGYFGGTADWGLQYSNGTPVLSNVAIVQGQPTLLVASVTFGPTNVVNLYVNPTSLGGSAPSTPSATISTTGSVAFESLSYEGGYTTNDSSLADIRFGTTYAAVTPTSSGQQSQTITFTAPTTPVTYGVSPISLSASASSGLAVTFSVVSGPGTVSGNTLTVTGVGTIVVAANQAGNGTYAAAPQVTHSIVVNQASQTINFTAPTTPVTFGVSPISLSATASSGLAVTFSVVSGPATVSGSTLTITGAGTVVVAANQAGSANYTAAAQVTHSIVVNQASQTITFTAPASPVTYGVSPISLSATASSGLAVSFSVVSGPGTVSGSTLTITGVGTVVVAANQAGNANYTAAAQVTQSVVVNAASGGTLLAYEPFGESGTTPFALNGASGGGDSGWAYPWVEQSGSTAVPGFNIASASPLTYSGLQTTTQYGTGGYGYQSAGRQLNVASGGPFNSYLSGGLIGASGQTVWLSLLLREDGSSSNGQPNVIYLNNISSGNSWEPASSDSIGVGFFGGTADWGLQYSNGTPVLSSVPVTQGHPTLLVVSVTFGPTNVVNLYINPTSLGGSAPATPSATISTSGSVAFQSLAYQGGYGTNNGSIADIRFGTTYAAVTPTSLTSQTITFTAPTSPVTYGVSPITLSATASSGLAVTFSVVSGPGTVSGNALTVTGAGTIVVAANQAGNSTYAPAPQVTHNIVVNQTPQTINFTAPTSPVTYGVSPISLSATATSGLAVTFSVVSGPGTVSGSTLTITGVGTVVVAANQAGNANYAAAAQVTQSVVVNAASGGGTLLAYEPFGEASGTTLNGLSGSGDSGWGAAWVEQSGSTAIPGYEILSTTPLTYSGLQTTGNYAIGGYEYQSAGRQLNVSGSGPFSSYLSSGLIGASGTSIWLSFLIREDVSNGDTNAVFLNNYSGGNAWVPSSSDSIGIGYFGGTADWGLQYSNGTPVLSNVAIVQGQATLLVVEVTFNTTNVINLYVNPTSLGGSAPATPSATLSTTGSVAFESLAYEGGYTTNNSSLADIRFGTTFAAVTP